MVENAKKRDEIYMYICLMDIMKSQNRIAVDIMLLPSDAIMGNAIEVNQALACARITYIDAELFG